MDNANALRLSDRRIGFFRVYDGKRSIGTVRRPDFSPMWTARNGSGKYVGQAATARAAANLLAPKAR